ncbi:50S ribosomal protein L15 [Candidatus Aerophobetes bacterium]|nr:50S ribosomal protein L15 [Candidatus Aerophobetes bacterium]
MYLKVLRVSPGATHKEKRVGRGPSSGHGKTSTRGHKGQKARSKIPSWFEGGQMPLTRRVPKRGFNPPLKQKPLIVNVKDLLIFNPNTEVTPEILRKAKLIRKKGKIKILGEGKINFPLNVKAHFFSKEAQKKIKEAGGSVEVLKC